MKWKQVPRRLLRRTIAPWSRLRNRGARLENLDQLHHDLVARIGTSLALFGLLLGANQLLEVRFDGQREMADRSYHQLLANLGSPRLAVRVGAIGQIPSVLRLQVPAQEAVRWWQGVFYWVTPEGYPKTYAYHESVLRVLEALAHEPKHAAEESHPESDALVDALCEIGSEGWYLAQPRVQSVREKCLSWIWQDAPARAISARPALKILRKACLTGASLDRMDLANADFLGSHLRLVTFRDSQLANARFDDSKLEGVSFRRAVLRDATFRGVAASGVDFDGADVAGADFTASDISVELLAGASNPELAVGVMRMSVR